MGRLQADAARDKLMGMLNIGDPHGSAGAEAAARVRMCSGGAASAYQDALPTRSGLRISISHLTWELRFRLGLAILPTARRAAAASATEGYAARNAPTTP